MKKRVKYFQIANFESFPNIYLSRNIDKEVFNVSLYYYLSKSNNILIYFHRISKFYFIYFIMYLYTIIILGI